MSFHIHSEEESESLGLPRDSPFCWECVVLEDRARIVSLEARIKELEGSKEFTSDWYKTRFERMDKWMRENAPDEAKNQYFSIQANGQPSPWEKPEYVETIHMLKSRAESAEARLKLAEKVVEAVRQEFDLGDYIACEMGVFPKSVVGGDNPYHERTPEMNHHNEQVSAWFESRVALFKSLAAYDGGKEKKG